MAIRSRSEQSAFSERDDQTKDPTAIASKKCIDWSLTAQGGIWSA